MDKREIHLVRPYAFADKEYHIKKWEEKNITALICQRKTNDLIQLCLESLLRFYPDISILVVDGDSQDESSLYLKRKAIQNSNIKIWTRSGINSHGITMDEAIKKHIKTRYVLLMDSDIIVERGGCIEEMLEEFKKDSNLYAIGSLMLVTRAGDACGPPKSDADILRYAHPSFSIYDVSRYAEFRPFTDHGAPCVYNMIDANKKGAGIGYYPVDKYISHLCGGSWTIPRVIWSDDHDVNMRPFITFIVDTPLHIEKLKEQDSMDFNIILAKKGKENNIVINGYPPTTFCNDVYENRFMASGEYVCKIPSSLEVLQPPYVSEVKRRALEENLPKEINVGGLMCIRRDLWQQREAVK